jgi:lipid-A-disaccharide synthase
MVVFYKSSRFFYTFVARWLLSTSIFSLPNLIAGRRIVPELIPHFGDAEPIVRAVSDLLESESQREAQRTELGKVVRKFEGQNAARAAAAAIGEAAGLTSGEHHATLA